MTIPPPRASADVGLIGLAVMGENLALNIADHGYRVAVYNRTTTVTEKFLAENPDTPGGLVGAAALPDFVAALKKPRKILILVKAGPPVDAVVEQLLGAGRRAGRHRGGLRQQPLDRHHPPREAVRGGLPVLRLRRERRRAGRALRPLADARRSPGLLGASPPHLGGHRGQGGSARPGEPLENYAPGKPVQGGEPCTAYIGPNGAGHYVKMVHNGIEYIDMQLISEAYHLLTTLGGMKPDRLSEIFAEWNQQRAQLLPHRDHRRHPPAARSRQSPALLRGRGAGRRRPEGHRQVDERERARHGHPRQRHRGGGLRALPLRAQGGAGGRRPRCSRAPGRRIAARRPSSSRRCAARSTPPRSAPMRRASSSCARRRTSTAGRSTSAPSPPSGAAAASSARASCRRSPRPIGATRSS